VIHGDDCAASEIGLQAVVDAGHQEEGGQEDLDDPQHDVERAAPAGGYLQAGRGHFESVVVVE
jgi:hypothetical protein